MHACLYVYIYACMYVCMYVCMYECMTFPASHIAEDVEVCLADIIVIGRQVLKSDSI